MAGGLAIGRGVAAVTRLADWLSLGLLAGVFLVSIAGIAARYLFHMPLAWGDELAMILLLWSVFIADAFVTRDADHVAFDLVWDRASPPFRRVMLVLQGVFFAVLFAVALPVVLDYVLFLWRERTPALEWRLDFVYACFALYIAMLVVRLAAKAIGALGPGWRARVEDGDPAQTSNIIG